MQDISKHTQDQRLRLFDAISSFIQDLNSGLGKKHKPVALYNRLIEKTTFRDTNAIDRHIDTFKKFFERYPGYIKTKTVTNGMRVEYSDRIFLDLHIIFSRTEPGEHKHIHKHLLTIYSLMNIGTEQAKEVLQTLKDEIKADKLPELNLPDTTEGKFIKDTIAEMSNHMAGLDSQNVDPGQMFGAMLSSGFVQKMFGDLQSKFTSGEMTSGSLLNMIGSLVGQAAPAGSPEMNQLKQFMDTGMSQIAQNENIPEEFRNQVNNMFKTMPGTESQSK